MDSEERLKEISEKLALLGDELSEVAMDVLRRAIEAGGDEAGGDEAGRTARALERRLNRARAAVERAAGLLDGAAAGGGDDGES